MSEVDCRDIASGAAAARDPELREVAYWTIWRHLQRRRICIAHCRQRSRVHRAHIVCCRCQRRERP